MGRLHNGITKTSELPEILLLGETLGRLVAPSSSSVVSTEFQVSSSDAAFTWDHNPPWVFYLSALSCESPSHHCHQM